MNGKQAAYWAGYYVALSTLSTLLGLGFVFVGVLVALGGPDPLLSGDILGTLAAARPLPVVAFGLLGALVWKLGQTAALYKTLTEAVDAEMQERFNAERVKSEILSVLDDRLADMQVEVQATRRAVESQARREAADEFEFPANE